MGLFKWLKNKKEMVILLDRDKLIKELNKGKNLKV